jgi:hypothetical protein
MSMHTQYIIIIHLENGSNFAVPSPSHILTAACERKKLLFHKLFLKLDLRMILFYLEMWDRKEELYGAFTSEDWTHPELSFLYNMQSLVPWSRLTIRLPHHFITSHTWGKFRSQVIKSWLYHRTISYLVEEYKIHTQDKYCQKQPTWINYTQTQ